MSWMIERYRKCIHLLDTGRPVMMFTVRLWMAHVFWVSGILKISDWSNTIYLFTNEFPVPFLSPAVAAVMGTVCELSCPVLLTIGLASRLATLPLLTMTAVINFTYENNIEHYYWAILLGMILCYGPDRLSLDYWLRKRFQRTHDDR